ncbi:T-cell surface glycoprotein CD8 alpha chain [Apodemus speciosus]|uniref:T-cell surface glycoprotein CD8 alpha chain n=1 Tax=Apodemus speciosus TaxID=105296 RepID=A0ABQ0EVJ9_APOSI
MGRDWTSPVIFTSGHPWPEPAGSSCCPWSPLSSATTGTEGGFANVPEPLVRQGGKPRPSEKFV